MIEVLGDDWMGTKGKEIVEVDVGKLIEELNKAYADEWLAYAQYWLGSKIVKGPMRGAVAAELLQHANDEFRHAGMIADRIIQLGGIPIPKPEDWYTLTNCGYEAPEDPYVETVLDQNIKGEQCAIVTYQKMLEMLEGKDPVTYNIVVQILADEVEHEEDLQALKEDIETMKKRSM